MNIDLVYIDLVNIKSITRTECRTSRRSRYSVMLGDTRSALAYLGRLLLLYANIVKALDEVVQHLRLLAHFDGEAVAGCLAGHGPPRGPSRGPHTVSVTERAGP